VFSVSSSACAALGGLQVDLYRMAAAFEEHHCPRCAAGMTFALCRRCGLGIEARPTAPLGPATLGVDEQKRCLGAA